MREKLINVDLLKEETSTLKIKLERAEQIVNNSSRILIERDTLLQEKARWEALIGQDIQSSSAIERNIADLRKEKELLYDKVGHFSTELKLSESVCKNQEQTIKELKEQTEGHQRKLIEYQDIIRSQERTILTIMKEKEGLTNILDSYNAEEGIQNPNFEKQKTERIKELERSLNERNSLLLEYATSSSKLDLTEFTILQKSLEATQIENDKLKKEISKLDQEIATLETRLGKGEYDRSKTKVLHFTMNPESIAIGKYSELEKLKQENDELKVRLAMLSGDSNSVIIKDISSLESNSQKNLEKEQLQKKNRRI